MRSLVIGWARLALVVLGIVGAAVMSDQVYAQTDAKEEIQTSEQITLSEDLENNPLAQDILKKIEQTKKWIDDLKERDYDRLENQKELEEKRQQVLSKLNDDLEEWEALWEYYSPKNSFGRFVDKIPDSQVQEVFWDQFEFKEQKVKAGRDALKRVFADGGSLHEARQAYLAAAETKRIEMIEANSQFNVSHNLAYYNQQVLFDRQGQLVDSPITGEQLRKYYEDFRTNPAYLEANPDDTSSWEELGRTNPDTECMKGEIVVHRFHARDYVCVTTPTAEMWVRLGMGEITGDDNVMPGSQTTVTPITRCSDGYVVVYLVDAEKYSCVLEDTANKWVGQGVAELHDPEDYIMQSIKKKESLVRIEEINQQIQEMQSDLEQEKADLEKAYGKKYDAMQAQSQEAEKAAVKDFNDGGLSKEELSKKVSSIREDLKSDEKKISREKARETKKLEQEYEQKMTAFSQDYELDPYIKIVPNSGKTGYEAVLRE